MSDDYEAFAVFMWQGNPGMHPLTCGNNSDHELTYDLFGGRGLFCPECDWRQAKVPDVVKSAFLDVARQAVETPDD